jgi:hypothetical protein
MKNKIIAYVEKSDRNIYLTIEYGALVSVNYSQGEGDIDLNFMNNHDEKLTRFVINKLQEKDQIWSAEHFFPSPYWNDQVNVIDKIIWDFILLQNLREDVIEEIMSIECQIGKLQNQILTLRQQLDTL